MLSVTYSNFCSSEFPFPLLCICLFVRCKFGNLTNLISNKYISQKKNFDGCNLVGRDGLGATAVDTSR